MDKFLIDSNKDDDICIFVWNIYLSDYFRSCGEVCSIAVTDQPSRWSTPTAWTPDPNEEIAPQQTDQMNALCEPVGPGDEDLAFADLTKKESTMNVKTQWTLQEISRTKFADRKAFHKGTRGDKTQK
ncbi:uncharacterized protein [Drosophila tropicalis]|uniref:uncharacterized protein n=1 Tax=Drosophila tropicalis TaxID=46794 RepID=UPI0035ABE7D1